MATKFTATKGTLGKNVETNISADGILTITVDLKKNFGPSASGKTTILATTSGNAAIPGANGAVLGLNLYTKP